MTFNWLPIFVLGTTLLMVPPTSAQRVGAAASDPAQTLDVNHPVERELKAGDTQIFELPLVPGQFVHVTVDQRGIDLVVRTFTPDGKRLAEVDSPNGDQGPEPVTIEPKVAGTYRIEVSSLDPNSPAGRYQIKIDELLTAEAYATRLAAEKSKQAAVIAWLKQSSIPIKTVEAGNGFDDLRPLKNVLRDVRYVGLGEETHGTREFFQFKHRMVEFLVREIGFRVFAIEASYAGCRNINDYIQGRTSDGAKALDSQGFWTWNTEEVRAMLDWMRTYNAGAPAESKIRFLGFDLQINREARDTVLAYLQRVAPDRAAAFAALPLPTTAGAGVDLSAPSLETTVEAAISGPPADRPAAQKRVGEIRAQYNELMGFLAMNETRFSLQTSPAEFADALHSARVIAQYIDAYTPSAGNANSVDMRDLYMAENFDRLAGAEPAGTRFIIWAHNFHIGSPDESPFRFGSRLRKLYGKQYYGIAFSFREGGFQAREANPKDPAIRLLTGFTSPPPSEGSIDWYLARTGSARFFVDLRNAKGATGVAWVDAPHPMRSIGSVYGPGNDVQYYAPVVLKQSFDGLFFIDTTTRARPNPSVKNVAPATTK
jgi:erythromycin esterase